jgi:hypothetical protein
MLRAEITLEVALNVRNNDKEEEDIANSKRLKGKNYCIRLSV